MLSIKCASLCVSILHTEQLNRMMTQLCKRFYFIRDDIELLHNVLFKCKEYLASQNEKVKAQQQLLGQTCVEDNVLLVTLTSSASTLSRYHEVENKTVGDATLSTPLCE